MASLATHGLTREGSVRFGTATSHGPVHPHGISTKFTFLKKNTSAAGLPALLGICVLVARGHWGAPALPSARLCALRKGATDADGLRPIASGTVLRRVVVHASLRVEHTAAEFLFHSTNHIALISDAFLAAYTAIRVHSLRLHTHVLVTYVQIHPCHRLTHADRSPLLPSHFTHLLSHL